MTRFCPNCKSDNFFLFGEKELCSTCMRPVTVDYQHNPDPICSCKNLLVQGEFGNICVSCGICDLTEPLRLDENAYPRGYFVTYKKAQPYTRAKRFKKYLMKACMSQSLSSIPDTTWEFLYKKQPYSGPAEILFTLKRSKLKHKCYDSLPLMTRHLCQNQLVPVLSASNVKEALLVFAHIDKAFPKNTRFISYLFLLEYILSKIGRADMLPFINRIQCPRRRQQYVDRITLATDQALLVHGT